MSKMGLEVAAMGSAIAALGTGFQGYELQNALADTEEGKALLSEIDFYICVDRENWQDTTFVLDSCFKDHAVSEAEDVHGIDAGAWPFDEINWDEAARRLKQDYTSVQIEGMKFWARV